MGEHSGTCTAIDITKIKKVVQPKPQPKNFLCTFPGCEMAFERAWKLEAHHFAVHIKVKPFTCAFMGCERKYSNKSHLQRHHKTFHRGCVLSCTYKHCPITFTTPWALKNHCKKQHEEAETHTCTECGTVFDKLKNYTRHMKKHAKQENLVCAVCLRFWNRKSLLRRHMKSHNMKTCPYSGCSSAFKTQSEIRRHLANVHPQEFYCDNCGKKFSLKTALRDHIQQHFPLEARNAFSCPYEHCQRSYLYLRNLNQHIASFHVGPRFYCDQKACKSSYLNAVALAAHKKRKHNDVVRKDSIIARMTASICSDDVDATKEATGESNKSAKEEGSAENQVLFVMRRV